MSDDNLFNALKFLHGIIRGEIFTKVNKENFNNSDFKNAIQSSINKGDFTMDKYFNLFADLMIAEPMQAKMARGNGSESVSKGASRSPCGQHEDLDLSSVSFIHKLSKPSKEVEEIMERIRSSR